MRDEPLIDTHAHLMDARLVDDLPDVLARAEAAGTPFGAGTMRPVDMA